MPKLLTAEQVTQFESDGFLVLDQLVSAFEVAELLKIYDWLFETKAGHATGDHFDLAGSNDESKSLKLPQILGPSEKAPAMRETQAWRDCETLVQDLFGPTASRGGDHAILKPAHSGAETPWHQDEAYWDPAFHYNSVSIWIPLQDVDESNGCMVFMRGSHKLPIVPHRQIGGDSRVHGLEIVDRSILESGEIVTAPIPAGGCTIHHNRTLHYTPGNKSDRPRRAWIVGGGVAGVAADNEREFPWQKAWQTARQERAEKATR